MGNDTVSRTKAVKKGSSKASSSGSAEGPLVFLKPSQIMYTYSKVLPYFSGCGRTLAWTLGEIEAGKMKPSELPAIAVISAEVPVGGAEKPGDTKEEDGWSSDEDGRGNGNRMKKGKKRGGGGGAAAGGGAKQTVTKFFSTNNRRLWVLKQCELKGLLGEAGTIGVRLQRPDVSKRMVEKGTRSFRIERSCESVKIMDVDAPARVGKQEAEVEDGEKLEDELDSKQPVNDTKALEQVTEALEEFHPVLRPYH